MPANRDTHHPSRSPCPTSRHVSAGGPAPSPQLDFFRQSPPSTRHLSIKASIPSADRNKYSNKESARVNAGLDCTSGLYKAAHGEETTTLVVNVDFSQFVVPPVQPARPPTAEALVHRLLQPPLYAFLHGTLSLHWVIGAVGYKNFVFFEADERFVLAQESELRAKGKEFGVPAVFLEWLCGYDAAVSASELGVCLTPEFFDEQ